MMQTSVEATALKALLDELALALRRLHKALVGAEATIYARDIAPIGGPAHLLRLLTTHSHFAWLRTLSELMVDLDELRQDAEITKSDVRTLRATIEGLVGPRPAALPEFRAQYIARIQETPDIAIAHHALRQVLQRMPAADGETTSEELHERHVESEVEKHEPHDK